MVRNLGIKQEAVELRKLGLSYLQISKRMSIPKSTLSGWFSKEAWSEVITSENSKNLNKKSLFLANKARATISKSRRESYITEATNEFELFKDNPLFISGINLYWGEGEKTESGRVSVVNTDSNMLKVMAEFYRKILKIPEDKIRIGLFIYEDLKEQDLKLYWSSTLDIPLNQFIKTQVLKSRSRLTKRKSKYGVCSLYFSSTELSVKIRQWILLFQQSILNEH